MGGFSLSVHFKGGDVEAIRKAAKQAVFGSGAKFLIAKPVNGWIGVYPSMELLDTDALERFVGTPAAAHAVALIVHDSDILCYWYFRDGELADYYHSAPDYFGESNERDMEAKGNAEAFAGLLDEKGRGELAAVIRARMINGESVGGGSGPVFEEKRLARVAEILGIAGAMGSYEYLMEGEEVEGVGVVGGMEEVG